MGSWTGRAEDAIVYAQSAAALQTDPGYQLFASGWADSLEAQAHLFAGGFDRCREISSALAAETGFARVLGLCGQTLSLGLLGQSAAASALADDSMNAARPHANPHLIAFAYFAWGSAYTEDDPHRAIDAFRDGLAYTRQHRLPLFEMLITRNTAGLEAVHGDLDLALDMFTASINGFHQSGDAVNLTWVFAHLAVFFDRIGRSETAATAYGITTGSLREFGSFQRLQQLADRRTQLGHRVLR